MPRKTPDEQTADAVAQLVELNKSDEAAATAVLERLLDKPLQLHAKLADIAVIAERIPKRGTAPAAMGGFPFVQVGDAADFIRKALGRRHISMQPVDIAITGRNEHATSKGGVMTTLDGVSTWLLTDGDTGETATIVSFGAGSDTGDKYSGKLMTSLMKYALLSGFQLSTGEDTELNDTTDKTMGQQDVERRPGTTPSHGGRQSGPTQPQQKVIGDLLRALGAGTTGKALDLLEKTTGKTIDRGDDPNAALAAFLATGLTDNERGKLIHDLGKLKDQKASTPDAETSSTQAEGATSTPETETIEEPSEDLEVGPQA